MPDPKSKAREREAQLKALREELEAELERDLAANLNEGGMPPLGAPVSIPIMENTDASPKRILEALFFASAKPLPKEEIKRIVGAGFSRPPTLREVEAWIAELKEEYHREGRSFELREVAGGWQIVTLKGYAPWVARLELERRVRQASRSALETLAILAYKQPVTRAQIEELRGVDISGVLSTLLEKGSIKIVGKKEVAGRRFLYGTTEEFLEHFGLRSLKDLPPIEEIKSLVERAVRREEFTGEGQEPA